MGFVLHGFPGELRCWLQEEMDYMTSNCGSKAVTLLSHSVFVHPKCPCTITPQLCCSLKPVPFSEHLPKHNCNDSCSNSNIALPATLYLGSSVTMFAYTKIG